MPRTTSLYERNLIWTLFALIGLHPAGILVDAADSIAWTIPSTVLLNASQVLDPRFAGFGIEFSNLFSYTGTAASPNSFSQNLIANLKAVAGVAPLFRIGGNTQDYLIYDSSFTGSYFGQNSDATKEPELTDWVPFNEYNYGDEVFKALGTFPTTSQFIFGLNLAYDLSDYLTRITSTASAVIDALGDNVYSFEIGNEPDLYDSTAPYRVAPQYNGTAWSGSVYSQEWLTRASAIQSQNNSFEAGTTASTIGTTFEISMLAKDGIDKTDAVFHYNQHDYFYYIDVSGYTLTRGYMMNHGNMVSQFSSWAAQAKQAAAAGKPYLLGEMAAVGPQGLAGVTDVFGCAIFTLDFLLYTATLNVTNVLFHMTDIGNQSAWQPITVGGIAPWVRPSYYAHIITSTLIGPSNDTTIAEIDVTSQLLQDYAGQASSYVVYRGNTIYAAVLINLKEFNSTDTETTDTQLNFTLNVPPEYAGNGLTVYKLSAPGADSFKQVTWAGINYQTDNGVPTTGASNDTSFVTVSSDGQFSVLVRDSQAVVIHFNSSGILLDQATSGTSNASTTTDPGSTSTSSNGSANISGSSSSSASFASPSYTLGNVILITFVIAIGMAFFWEYEGV